MSKYKAVPTVPKIDKNVCRKVQGKQEPGWTCLQTLGTCEFCPEWWNKKQEIKFTVPLVPPSVNHYVKHTRTGRHYVTKEAKAFKTAVAIFARDKGKFHGRFYEVSARIFLGRNQRRDVDNCGKVLLDALCESGVIDSDARVNRCILEKARDRENPRTEITVREL